MAVRPVTSPAAALPFQSAPGWSRLDGVDLLRGLAIFLVLMNHINMQLQMAHIPYTQGLPRQLASSLVWNGQFGVQIFFAVSGFLITATSLRRWHTLPALNVRAFYQIRFARIAPLLLAVLGVLSLLHLAHVPHFIVSAKTGGLGRALFAALTFHSNWLEAHRGYLPGNWDILWSLSVEEMFYLFFPLLCRLLRRKALLVALLFVFVMIGPFARSVAFNPNPVWREYSYLGGMDAIAMGCLTAMLVEGRHWSRPWRRLLGGVGVSVLVLVLGFSLRLYAMGLGRNGLDMTLLGLGTCLVISAIAQSSWQAPWLLRPLLSMGGKSYEIYLTHMFVVIALYQGFALLHTPVWATPLLFVAVVVLASLLGEGIARFYSEPVNRALRTYWGDGPRKLPSSVGTA